MKVEWADHLRRNHARLNRKDSRANRAGPRKRCDFCGDQVILNILWIRQFMIYLYRLSKLRLWGMWRRSMLERLSSANFALPLTRLASPILKPSRRWQGTWFSSTRMWVLKEVTISTIINSQIESYYEHMVYPDTLYGAICTGKDCGERGKILAFNPAALGVTVTPNDHSYFMSSLS